MGSTPNSTVASIDVPMTPTLQPGFEFPPVPPMGDPEVILSENLNDPSTPLGALCWARVETANQLMQVLFLDVDLASALNSVSDQVNANDLRQFVLTSDLGDDIRLFGETLFDSRDQATLMAAEGTASQDEIMELFMFEEYPNIREYVSLAESSAACVRP